MTERRIRLDIEYEGTGLSGWQRQDNAETVQGHIERALGRILCTPTQVTGASRTDAGVHARGQVAAFTTDTAIPPYNFRRALNSYLPEQIAVIRCSDVPLEFHPRHASLGKHYRYLLWCSKTRSPLLRSRSWNVTYPIDVAPMNLAAAALCGEHDFSAFRATGCTARTTRRRITTVSVTRDGNLVTIDVHGNAFLRNMVRIIAGSLMEVGACRRPPQWLGEVLAARDRTLAGRTAPPQGLTLMEIIYPGPGQPERQPPSQ